MSTPKRTVVRTPSRDVQAALVDAAETVLVRDGPAAVTVRAVATEAGVAPMGVYNRFGSKEGLVDALLVRGFEGLRAAVAAPSEPDPIDRLRSAGVGYRQFALGNRQHYRVMFGGALPTGEASPELETVSAAAFQALVDHVSTGMAAGRLMRADPMDVAQQIWSTVHGAVLLEMAGQTLVPDPEATYLRLLDLLIRGLSVPPGESER